jgi:hypothetical protein
MINPLLIKLRESPKTGVFGGSLMNFRFFTEIWQAKNQKTKISGPGGGEGPCQIKYI